MLGARVGRLEDDMREVRAALGRIEARLADVVTNERLDPLRNKLADTREDMRELKGMVARTPSDWQLYGSLIALFFALVGAAFAFVRMTGS